MELINVMAASLDARIGSQPLEGDIARQNTGLSSAADQRHLRRIISSADAIVVGASSIRANGECLDHPGRGGEFPRWFICCQKDIPSHYLFWQQTHIPRILVSQNGIEVPEAGQNLESLTYGDSDPAEFVYQQLSERGLQKVLLFGGGIINSWFYQKGLVDRLLLTLSPLFIGHKDAPYLIQPTLQEPIHFSLENITREDDYVFLDYRVLKKAN